MYLIKRSGKRIHLIAGASLVLAACATVQPLEYPPDHPANPGAPAGAETPPLSTLATYKPLAGSAGPVTHATPDADQGTAPQAEQTGKEGPHEHQQ
jgi:hypothetical protein